MSAEENKLDMVEVAPTYDECYDKGYEVGVKEGRQEVIDAVEKVLATL